ncbi:MAG: hypothetical protein Q9180_009729, partial [Flavoplaca navasiana]
MPSMKGQKRLVHEDMRLNILEAKPSSQRPSKLQSKARLDSRIPKPIHFHPQKLQEQLNYAYHAGKGQKGVPYKVVPRFCEPFEHLYAELLPEIEDGPIAAAASHVPKTVQHHDDKRARIKAFRHELPPPFKKYTNVDPGLAIFVPIDDPNTAAILREFEAIRLLHKVREALHEAHWWFGEDGFISWVIAVRQLPAGHLEVFTDSAHHRDRLVEHSAWQTGFLERLVDESCTYGVSVVGLPAASVRKFLKDDVRQQRLAQQLFDWNRSRIQSFQ